MSRPADRLARMIDHLGLQAAGVNAAAEFYLEVFAPIGMQEVMRFRLRARADR
jgi:hypothetical protein